MGSVALLAGGPRLLLRDGARMHGRVQSSIDDIIRQKMDRDHIPGVVACLVRDGDIVWSNTYGWANLEKRIPMSLDGIQNICSISKSFTATAVMQLWERGEFELDDDVSDYLPFPVRNPAYPKTEITFAQLLTHRSSIRDGIAYSRMYHCGDPTISLGDWVREYLRPGGAYYDFGENFYSWAPGTRWAYNNVAQGLLGHLVERISGIPFGQYCEEHIFQPLGMNETSWYLRDLDLSKHVVPYTWVEEGHGRAVEWHEISLEVIREGIGPSAAEGTGYQQSCIYSHPNLPDGFLRTSVRQLSRYLLAYLNKGTFEGGRILNPETVREMLKPHVVPEDRTQGIIWYAPFKVRERLAWGHGGRDPGINTDIRFLPDEGIGAIAFMNTTGVRPFEITERLLVEAPNLLEGM